MKSLASADAAAGPVFDLPIRARPRWDPRLYQIATLAGLLGYGVCWLDLEVQPQTAVAIVASALAAQLACERLAGRPRFDPRSALISGLSLCLLLRTESPAVAMVAAVVAIASKFIAPRAGQARLQPDELRPGRDDARHRQACGCRPGNGAARPSFAFLLASAGGLVVNRAARADVTWTFLACYAALLVGRSLWLGEPLAIPLHRLENGALVLFAFFMISDPQTTPDSRAGRILFAALVALGAYARAVLALPDQWPALVARRLLARRPADRPAAAGLALPVAPDRDVTQGQGASP